VILLGLLFISGATGIVFGIRWIIKRQAAAKLEQAAAGRDERVTSVAAVALAPLPIKLPLVERAGNDAYGYRDRMSIGLLSAVCSAAAAEAFETAEREIEPSLGRRGRQALTFSR
jgi:hypothetical protein